MSSDRISVEMFGLLRNFWTVMGSKYRWAESSYNSFFTFCISLTKVHVKWHPVHEEGGNNLKRYINGLYCMGESIATKLRQVLVKYREKRR